MTAIYHITHLRNLPGILQTGGLWCDREIAARNLTLVSIAHQHIKARRARRQVPCAAGGTLADYVPFYFAPRSPMLFAIHRGVVEGYHGGQEAVVHLVASAERIAQSQQAFAFTDGHAEMDISRFYAELADLSKLDWDIMKSRYWNDTIKDGDRKRRRQAEFLVHRFCPWASIERIGVINHKMRVQVSALLQPLANRPAVAIEPKWYY